MKLRWSGLFVVLPAVAALILATMLDEPVTVALGEPTDVSMAVATPTEASPLLTCDDAERFLDRGMRERAQDVYDSILTATPGLDCAIDGQIAILALETAIAQTPTPAPTPTPTPTPTNPADFRPIENMVARGEDDQAATAIAGMLDQDPYATPPATLSHLDGNPYNDLSFGLPFVDIGWPPDWQWTGFPGWDMADQIMDSTEDFLASWGWLPTILLIALAYLLLNAWHNRKILLWRYLRVLWRHPLTIASFLFRNPVRVVIVTPNPAARSDPDLSQGKDEGTGDTGNPQASATVSTGPKAPGFFARARQMLTQNTGPSSATPTQTAGSGANGLSANLGDRMTARIRHHYRQVGKARVNSGSKLLLSAEAEATASATVVGLATAVSVPGVIGAAVKALIDLLRLNQPWSLQVHFVEGTPDDAGVELQLVSRNAIVDSEIIRIKEAGFLPPELHNTGSGEEGGAAISAAYMSVAEDVAIWLYDQLTFERQISHRHPNSMRRDQTTLSLEWSNWKSYAAFRQGVEAYRTGQVREARRLFDQSLAQDPAFVPARINRAVASTQLIAEESEKASDARDEYLRIASTLEQIENGLSRGRKKPVQWFTARFNRIAALDYAAGWPTPCTRTMRSAEKLAREMLSEVKSLGKVDQARFGNAASLLHATEQLRLSKVEITTGLDQIIEEVQKKVSVLANDDDFSFVYAYACLNAAGADIAPPPQKKTLRDLAFVHLRRALQLRNMERMGYWPKYDPSLYPLRNAQDEATRKAFEALIREFTPVNDDDKAGEDDASCAGQPPRERPGPHFPRGGPPESLAATQAV